MIRGKVQRVGGRLAAFWLMIQIHADALVQHPTPYLTAVKWRILGKKVRARGQMAPLLGRSRKAYAYWSMCDNTAPTSSDKIPDGQIVGLIVTGDDVEAKDFTLASLENSGLKVVVLSKSDLNSSEKLEKVLTSFGSKWLMPVRSGDRVSRRAGRSYMTQVQLAETSCSVVYADDDCLDRWGQRSHPYFKPDWNAELHKHHDILTGSCIVSVDAIDVAAATRHNDPIKSLVDQAVQRGAVHHIPAVLHHRATRYPAPYCVEPLPIASRLPPVSVIIPTRDRADLLRTCIAGLRATRYPHIEIIVANNDSSDPETLTYLGELMREGVTILDQPGPFNYSTINNNAVSAARGELLCLMNNDIEVLSPDWLEVMSTQAIRPEVGAVGAQLLYPDGRIQHAGVVVGVGNAAGHAHRFLRPEAEGYFRRHALPQYVSAVTAACMVVRKDRFLAVGGLNERDFAVAFNDVDLCLRLNRKGWQSLYEPRAVLIHHESISRGHDTDPVGAARFASELAALQRTWRTNEIVDPFHHPMLSRASEQFALDLTSLKY